MARVIVQHDEDPGIAIILEQDENGVWYGEPCTECGYRTAMRWSLMDVQQDAEIHIDMHESGQ